VISQVRAQEKYQPERARVFYEKKPDERGGLPAI
jgi:hypothetical protein